MSAARNVGFGVRFRTSYDTRIGVAYALVYPVAMIVKIVVAQLLAGLG